MATPWEDKIKNRNPKQLTIFVAPTLNKPWRRAFDDALSTFNQLSQDSRLGVTMVAPENVTKPDPNGEGGADVQFAFVFVPQTPMVVAQMAVGRGKFKDVQREVGHGIKHFIAAHELIHVCGLHNSDHTKYGPDADLFIEQPQPFSGDFNKPDDDKLMLHNSAKLSRLQYS